MVKVNFSGSAILCQPRTAGTALSDPVGCPDPAVWGVIFEQLSFRNIIEMSISPEVFNIYIHFFFLKSIKTSEAPRFLRNQKFSNSTTLTGTLFTSGL